MSLHWSDAEKTSHERSHCLWGAKIMEVLVRNRFCHYQRIRHRECIGDHHESQWQEVHKVNVPCCLPCCFQLLYTRGFIKLGTQMYENLHMKSHTWLKSNIWKWSIGNPELTLCLTWAKMTQNQHVSTVWKAQSNTICGKKWHAGQWEQSTCQAWTQRWGP